METIPKSVCRKIGFIRKTHGVQGELVLEYETEFEESVADAVRFFLETDGLLVPFFLAGEGLRFKSVKTVLVTLDGVENEEEARRLIGSSVYLFEEEIIDEKEEGTASAFTGYRLFDENSHEIGLIKAVDDYSGNIVFTLDYKNQELLVPFNQELLLELDDEKKIIRLRLPEGLID
jgi:16S rRNA processing protein RimM